MAIIGCQLQNVTAPGALAGLRHGVPGLGHPRVVWGHRHETHSLAALAQEAARGQIVYITEHGERAAATVPAAVTAELERLPPGELAELPEDFADAAAAREARASIEALEPLIPWDQVKAEAGLKLVVYKVVFGDEARKAFERLDRAVRQWPAIWPSAGNLSWPPLRPGVLAPAPSGRVGGEVSLSGRRRRGGAGLSKRLARIRAKPERKLAARPAEEYGFGVPRWRADQLLMARPGRGGIAS